MHLCFAPAYITAPPAFLVPSQAMFAGSWPTQCAGLHNLPSNAVKITSPKREQDTTTPSLFCQDNPIFISQTLCQVLSVTPGRFLFYNSEFPARTTRTPSIPHCLTKILPGYQSNGSYDPDQKILITKPENPEKFQNFCSFLFLLQSQNL